MTNTPSRMLRRNPARPRRHPPGAEHGQHRWGQEQPPAHPGRADPERSQQEGGGQHGAEDVGEVGHGTEETDQKTPTEKASKGKTTGRKSRGCAGSGRGSKRPAAVRAKIRSGGRGARSKGHRPTDRSAAPGQPCSQSTPWRSPRRSGQAATASPGTKPTTPAIATPWRTRKSTSALKSGARESATEVTA